MCKKKTNFFCFKKNKRGIKLTMNKIILAAFILLPFYIVSQDLNEAYLASLPEEVRLDVEEKIKAREKSEEPVYRRASSMIDKDEINNSDRFGSNIFDMMQSSFMPINEPNFDSSYVLDFGDTILVQLTGQKKSIDRLRIERDGSINIPEFGKLFVSGLSLESANELIKNKVQNALIGTKVYTSLVAVRDIQIIIAGMAFNPGIYTLNGNSNALHAISMAGGIQEDGSYRSIEIIRDGKVIFNLDIYDLFINGTTNFGPNLRTGDSIFVRPHHALVNAASGVKRPAVYELTLGESFDNLITYANGISRSADISSIAVERLNKDKVELIRFKNLDDLAKTGIKDGDSLYIKEFNYRSVSISGAIQIPGTYFIEEGEKLSSLIKRAGGYKDSAYPFGGFLNNNEAFQRNEAARDKLYKEFLENIISDSSSQTDEGLPIILEQIRNTPISGRVMAEFDIDFIKNNPDLDTTLDDGDELIIPFVTQQVYIFGEVNTSGTIRHKSGGGINYYLNNAGGILETSDKHNIYVVHPNGRTQRLKASNNLSFLNSQNNNIPVYPGSIIYVPRKSSLNSSFKTASIWAPIVSSIALSMASISAINN